MYVIQHGIRATNDKLTYGFVIQPDIAAPGVNILAAHSDPKNSEDRFIFLSGTSMACPHVSGVAALIKSVHWEWSPAAIRSALITTGTTNIIRIFRNAVTSVKSCRLKLKSQLHKLGPMEN